jgi:hypothetical protein
MASMTLILLFCMCFITVLQHHLVRDHVLFVGIHFPMAMAISPESQTVFQLEDMSQTSSSEIIVQCINKVLT